MSPSQRGPDGRPRLRRGVIILPSAFTLANLFFGIWAIVAASEGQLIWAGWFIIFSGILDMLDGRIARFTRTGSGFGGELDSLVDAISFGVAPGMILYHQFYSVGAWSWLISFIYISAVVVRLARFNVEQTGGAKRYFLGLPSTTAGMTLAAFYPFSQTALFQEHLSTLPWAQLIGVGTILLCALLLSHIPYAKVPRVSFGSARGILTSAFLFGCMIAAITLPRYYFFPALVIYILWGLVRAFLLGLQEGIPDTDPLIEEDDDPGNERPMDYRHLSPKRTWAPDSDSTGSQGDR